MSKPQPKHFAIGLVVEVRKGAKPVGWPEGERFTDHPGRRVEVITVAEAEPGVPFGSFEAGGWFWAPEDLVPSP